MATAGDANPVQHAARRRSRRAWLLHRARRSVAIALLVASSLLFQQLAVAAHACGVEMGAHATMADAMADMPCCADADGPQPVDALCSAHCEQATGAVPEARGMAQLPAVLPPQRFAPVRTRIGPLAADSIEDVYSAPGDPPPTLRFCSLLI